MPLNERGSLTKEPPLATLDATLGLITPGMTYDQLRALATDRTHPDAPGLLRARFLRVGKDGRIQYDHLLSLIRALSVNAPLVRKVMYFTWMWRDDRLRAFIVDVVADRSGRWRPAALTRKAGSEHFEEWMKASSAQKARSNFEFFLIEAGLYNPRTKAVNLELSDGWLAEAMLTAGQYEPNSTLKAVMVRDPLGTLSALGLNGLINVPATAKVTPSAVTVADVAQSEDDTELGSPEGAPAFRNWLDRTHTPITRKQAGTVIDLVALERANASHLALERIVARQLGLKGIVPGCSNAIDMCFSDEGTSVLIEIKSCHAANWHSQVRRGISQLLEYRYLYRDRLRNDVLKVLVLETEPPPKKQWLLEFCRTLGVVIVWRDGVSDLLRTAEPPAPFLEGIAVSVR